MRKHEANKELIFCRVSEQPVALATPNLSGFTNSTFANSVFSHAKSRRVVMGGEKEE